MCEQTSFSGILSERGGGEITLKVSGKRNGREREEEEEKEERQIREMEVHPKSWCEFFTLKQLINNRATNEDYFLCLL